MDHNRPIHSTSTLPHSGVHHTSSHHHHHTLPHHHSSRSSPPLPPPPLPEEDQHPRFGQPASSSQGLAIVSDEPDLPGWVPKNYIEKGTSFCGQVNLVQLKEEPVDTIIGDIPKDPLAIEETNSVKSKTVKVENEVVKVLDFAYIGTPII
ncbi:uncharacterized protein LOC142319993 [Lycorma delicatula]|uniref:uncharacterized protein LOC142319993 n=1 Tax=Lycorma delicatula TaxID=130591 RepID=UPI003F5157EF